MMTVNGKGLKSKNSLIKGSFSGKQINRKIIATEFCHAETTGLVEQPSERIAH